MEAMVLGRDHGSGRLEALVYGPVPLAALLLRLRVQLVYEARVVDVERVGTDSDDRAVFFVHFFHNPDVLSAADKVVVGIIPCCEC